MGRQADGVGKPVGGSCCKWQLLCRPLPTPQLILPPGWRCLPALQYKRQLLNVLGIIHRYDRIKRMTPAERAAAVPRICVVGGKAAPGYEMAKRIIKLVSAVADKVRRRRWRRLWWGCGGGGWMCGAVFERL